MPEKIFLANVKVNLISGQEILDELNSVILENTKETFVYVNAHGVNLSQKYDWFKKFYNRSKIVYADGQGIRLASLLLGLKVPPHVNLTRWVWDLLPYCEKKNYSIFLLGAKEKNIIKAVNLIRKECPAINISGYSHGYFEKQGKETEEVVEKINKLKPNILIVAMGMPIQEKWILDNFNRLHVNAIFNAGSCLDFLAGAKKVCPKWLSNIGLEWLFRLVHEPRRLFVRYIIGNPKFLYYIFTRNKKVSDE
jgi:N-acetylglucosaminyldiphosphoundecaprenol N-acetyl-beta-D-mannosaminyltransferase